jgi:hypothetical protein
MTTRLLPVDAGCWIDGHWGQYGVARSIEIARDFGYSDLLIVDIAEQKLMCMQPSYYRYAITDEQEELLSEAADEVVDWLNDNVAPQGFTFGWYEGEFFLQSQEWWSEC